MCALSINVNLRINLEETILNIKDLSSICRMCFCKNNLQRIDELYIEGLCLANIFSQIISIGSQECEKYPNQLCFECISKLLQVHLFIEQIKEHELILKTVLESQDTILICESEIKENKEFDIQNKVNTEEQFIILENEKYKAEQNAFDHAYFAKLNEDAHNISIKDNHIKKIEKIKEKLLKNKKIFECDICQKRFAFQQNLKRHKSVHNGKKYQCSLCDKTFTRGATRDEHIRVHTGERPYVCVHCGKRFNRAISHYQHMRLHKHRLGKTEVSSCNIKRPSPRFRCEICNKLLLTKHSLQTHILTHTDEKPNLCNVCGKRFITKAALESHMKTHTGERPYTCDVCKKTFSHSSSLNTHKLIHTGSKPHKCKVCARSFVQASHLRTHQRTHTDERPFICCFCGKAFAQNYNLRVHVRIHTGETPYVCSVCGCGYHNSSQLKKHTKVHITNKNIYDIPYNNEPVNDI